MLIVLSLYFIVVWLVFGKFKWLPWNRLWKTVVYSIAGLVALVVVGALQFYTPVSKMAVVQNDTQLIYSLVGGQVDSVEVAESQQVETGDILFQLDPEPFQYAVDQSSAALKLAELRLRDTEILVEKQAAPRTNLDLYTAERDQAQASYDQAVYQLENSVIRAPASGVITMATLQVGEVVAANTPELSLIQTGAPRIAAAFKQNGLGLIKPGARATVLFSADPGKIYETTVFRVAPESIQGQMTVKNVASPIDALASSTGLYPVWIAFPEDAPAALRRSGMAASVTVFTSEGNPINALANILQILSSWMAYIF